jgi:hypothetical protein
MCDLNREKEGFAGESFSAREYALSCKMLAQRRKSATLLASFLSFLGFHPADKIAK